MRKLFVWDFHGVLEQGTEGAVYEISNRALEERGYRERFTREFCDSLYGQKWHYYFQVLMPDLDIDRCLDLQKTCISIGEQNPSIMHSYIRPHPQAHKVLQAIGAEGHKQILISNTGAKALSKFVAAVDMEHVFDHVIPADHLHPGKAKEKVDALESYLQACNDSYQEIIAIDDNASNAAYKRIRNLKFILYRHQPPFPECEADLRTHRLEDILDFCFAAYR